MLFFIYLPQRMNRDMTKVNKRPNTHISISGGANELQVSNQTLLFVFRIDGRNLHSNALEQDGQ